MDTGMRKRLDSALKESGFCLASLERTEHAINITTPFIMPDGDHIHFYAAPARDGGWLITDFGAVSGQCLFIRGHVGSVPESYRRDINRVLDEYGAWYPVSFEQDSLRLKTTDDRLADALRHFAQIILHVARVCSFGAEAELDTGLTTITSV